MVAASVLLPILVLGALAALLLPTIQPSSNRARQNACHNALKQLQVALMNYHDAFGRFPPPYIADEQGRPMHSWRVLILPYIEQMDLFKQYDFNEPWNGPNNSRLIASMPDEFYCPSSADSPSMTNYLAVVGPGTAWHGVRDVAGADLGNHADEAIMLVEVADSGVHWLEPRDMTVAEALRGINRHEYRRVPSSNHPCGVHISFSNGKVQCLPADTSQETLRTIFSGLSINGNAVQ